MRRLTVIFFALIAASGVASACFGQQREIIGAGATSPYPLYSKMSDVTSRE